MKEDGNRFEIVFNCDLEAISDTVNLCIAHVENRIAANAIDLGIITRIKWVIMEMLTNAIKHSGVEECVLTILTNGKQLLFEKEDTGKPLVLKEYVGGNEIKWPLSGGPFPKNFQVYHNGTESLSAYAENPTHTTFFIEEIGDQAMPALLFNISEHFGLLILAKASDLFEYEYEPESGTNRFRSTFNLLDI